MTKTLPNNPNRTMSRADFEIPVIRACAEAVQDTQRFLKAQGMQYSHWCGQLDDAHLQNGSTRANEGTDYEPLDWAFDEPSFPWFTLWEYAWTLWHSGLHRGDSTYLMKALSPARYSETWNTPRRRILSLGGSSSSFELTLARMGHKVTIIEQRPYTCANTREIAKKTGWDIQVLEGKIEDEILTLAGDPSAPEFDHVVSINVLHLAGYDAQTACRNLLHNLIRPGGRASFTFDYLNPNPKRYVDDPFKHFKWAGFKPWGARPEVFTDNGERGHFFYPDPMKGYYTAGALFLERC